MGEAQNGPERNYTPDGQEKTPGGKNQFRHSSGFFPHPLGFFFCTSVVGVLWSVGSFLGIAVVLSYDWTVVSEGGWVGVMWVGFSTLST